MAVPHTAPLELGWQTWTLVAIVLVVVIAAGLLMF
jgi:hypothetical protein